MRLLMTLPVGTQLRGGDPAGIVDLAQRAEGAGIDGVILGEHVVMGSHPEAYAWGKFPFEPNAPFPEPIVVLSAIASVTSRIVLSTGILIAPLRPAPLLAKQVTTLDQLSHGRIELGVGGGWQREELEAHGVEYAKRGQILTDTIAACRSLWSEQPATFESPSFAFSGLWCEPGPMRKGGPPIHFGGTLNERNIDRIVRLGDGWIPIMGENEAGIAEGVSVLRERMIAFGRDPSELHVRSALPLQREDGKLSLTQTLGGIPHWEALGATDLTVPLAAFVRSEHDVEPVFEELQKACTGRSTTRDTLNS
jgi:probable F420-dependent oxidoreductase